MKFKKTLGWSSALCLSAMPLSAQETNQVEQLKKQLQELQGNFQKIQQQQREQIAALQKQIEALQPQQTEAAKQPAAESVKPAVTPSRSPVLGESTAPWSPTAPIRLGSAQNYISLSFDALVAAGWSTAEDIESLRLGGHDPKQRGFTVQNLETVFDGKVDPYFRWQANIVLQLDPAGETTIEVEEAYL